MVRGPSGNLRLALTLVATWAAATIALTVLLNVTGLDNRVFKLLPFILAGYVTGWLVPVTTRRPKIIATATLVVVSALAWTAFAIIGGLPVGKALVLFGAGLPVMVVACLWAYFGMYLGSRRYERAPTPSRLP